MNDRALSGTIAAEEKRDWRKIQFDTFPNSPIPLKFSMTIFVSIGYKTFGIKQTNLILVENETIWECLFMC